MKLMLSSAIVAIAMGCAITASAQRIKVTEGDLSVLKGQTSIRIEFTYNNMKVGKFDSEKEYLDKKTEEYNKKEPGRGDRWAKSWVADRKDRFEPKFIELFTKYSEMDNSRAAKYTIIFNTNFTEPGFNVGVMRKNAQINADVLIVETADNSKVIAKISVDKALGRNFWGSDYDTGERIAECYADAGKELGKYFKK